MRRRGKATYDDLLRAPEDRIAEIVEGQLYTNPRPATLHAFIGAGLTADLVEAFQRGRTGPGGWWILYEPELHLGEDILVPDLGGWRNQTLPRFPDANAIEIPPDWVCEILSPSTFDLDRRHKFPAYLRHEVGWIWIIDPRERHLEVFSRSGESWHPSGVWSGSERSRIPPFDAIEIDLAALWP